MKLSQHGREHLGYHEAIGLSIGSYDFQQKDFVGGVMLSVEEAKILENFCWRYASLLSTEEDAVHDKLVERIEQAEMSIASTQCENMSKKDEKIIILTVDDAKVLNALISDRNLCKSYPETTENFGKLLDQLIEQTEKSYEIE